MDGAIAGVAFVLALGIMLAGGLDAEPGGREPDVLGVGLVAAATLPVAARRLAPVPVFVVVSAAMIALWTLDYRTDIPFGPLIGIYTLGWRYGGLRWSRRIWPVLVVAALVPASIVTYLREGTALTDVLVPEMAVFALMLAGVWIAGDRVRLRRERMVELEERARRTEREAERERRVAAAEERIRIARELHDSAGHAINVILVQAGAARLLQERDPEGSRRALATVEQVARDTIGEIDRLVRVLRTGDDVDAGVPVPADPAALGDLVERHRATGLRIRTDVDGHRDAVPRSVSWAAYRILQEALTNAARHGDGSADLAVRFASEAVDITVTNPAPAGGGGPGGGHGIVGMRERATLLGGTLSAEQVNGGFRVHAHLPYAGAAR